MAERSKGDGLEQWHLALPVEGLDHRSSAVFRSLLCSFQKVEFCPKASPSSTSPAHTFIWIAPLSLISWYSSLSPVSFSSFPVFPVAFWCLLHHFTFFSSDTVFYFHTFNSSLNIHLWSLHVRHLFFLSCTICCFLPSPNSSSLSNLPLPHTHPACPLTSPTSSPSDLGQIVLANDVGVDSDLPVAPDGQALPHRTVHLVSKFRWLKSSDVGRASKRTWHYLYGHSLVKSAHLVHSFNQTLWVICKCYLRQVCFPCLVCLTLWAAAVCLTVAGYEDVGQASGSGDFCKGGYGTAVAAAASAQNKPASSVTGPGVGECRHMPDWNNRRKKKTLSLPSSSLCHQPSFSPSLLSFLCLTAVELCLWEDPAHHICF